MKSMSTKRLNLNQNFIKHLNLNQNSVILLELSEDLGIVEANSVLEMWEKRLPNYTIIANTPYMVKNITIIEPKEERGIF